MYISGIAFDFNGAYQYQAVILSCSVTIPFTALGYGSDIVSNIGFLSASKKQLTINYSKAPIDNKHYQQKHRDYHFVVIIHRG